MQSRTLLRRAAASTAALAGAAAVPLAFLATAASTRAYAVFTGNAPPPPPAGFEALFTFADPESVYATYGRAWVFIAGAFAAGAWALRDAWLERLPRVGRVGSRLLLVGFAVLAVGTVGDYWLGEAVLGRILWGASFAVTMLGYLAASVGGVLVGASMLHRRVGPRFAAVALAALPVGFLLIPVVPNMPAAGMLVAGAAWVIVGLVLLREGRGARE